MYFASHFDALSLKHDREGVDVRGCVAKLLIVYSMSDNRNEGCVFSFSSFVISRLCSSQLLFVPLPVYTSMGIYLDLQPIVLWNFDRPTDQAQKPIVLPINSNDSIDSRKRKWKEMMRKEVKEQSLGGDCFARSHLCMYVAVRRLSRLGVHTSKCIIRARGFVQV